MNKMLNPSSLISHWWRIWRAHDQAFHRLLRNSGWLLGAQWIVAGSGIIQSILIARWLGVAGYGIWALIFSSVSAASQLMSFRLGDFVVKYLTEAMVDARPHRKTAILAVAYLLSGLSGLCAFGVSWVLAPLAAEWLAKDLHYTPYFRLFAWNLLAGLATEASEAMLNAHGQFRTLAFLRVIGALVLVGAVGIWTMVGKELPELILIVVLVTAFESLLLHARAVRELRQLLGGSGLRVPMRVLLKDWRIMGRFLLSTNLSASVSLLLKDSNYLWLGLFRGPREVGYYKLAYSLASTALMPIKALVYPTYGEITRHLAAGRIEAVIHLLRQGSLTAAAWALPVSGGLVIASPFLIGSFYGVEFLPAFPALVILLLGKAFANLFYWDRPLLLSLGFSTFIFQVSMLLALLKISLVFLIAPTFGYIGMAVLLSSLYALSVCLCLGKASRSIAIFGASRVPYPVGVGTP